MRRNGRKQAGFTLLEILVGLAVIGFLLLTLVQGIRFGFLAWDHQARDIARIGEQTAASDALRRLIEAIEPGSDSDPVPVAGNASRMLLRTAMPMSVRPFGAQQVDAMLGLDNAGRLIMQWTPYLNAIPFGGPPPPQETVLLEGVRAVEFRFLPLPGRGPTIWQQTWSLPELPGLIKIRLVMSDASMGTWPDIIAAPRRDRRPE